MKSVGALEVAVVVVVVVVEVVLEELLSDTGVVGDLDLAFDLDLLFVPFEGVLALLE